MATANNDLEKKVTKLEKELTATKKELVRALRALSIMEKKLNRTYHMASANATDVANIKLTLKRNK